MTSLIEAYISSWASDGTRRDLRLSLTPAAIHQALSELDGEATTDLDLRCRDGSSLLVSGGPDAFVVISFTADDSSWTAGSERSGPDIVLNCGGQAGQFPATIVVNEATAAQAIRYFARTGSMDPELVWIQS